MQTASLLRGEAVEQTRLHAARHRSPRKQDGAVFILFGDLLVSLYQGCHHTGVKQEWLEKLPDAERTLPLEHSSSWCSLLSGNEKQVLRFAQDDSVRGRAFLTVGT
ncbi:MAG: hypothetical protein A3H27_06515 [Acidobacteria bacterium RIFCSPLOWO2_02_FULL_59_13]|nr:MAG: hypothetical protein A3H27_06515 [Acidobacteria bacterium RIFCSPLOWO2_02_FULL_59_13]